MVRRRYLQAESTSLLGDKRHNADQPEAAPSLWQAASAFLQCVGSTCIAANSAASTDAGAPGAPGPFVFSLCAGFGHRLASTHRVLELLPLEVGEHLQKKAARVNDGGQKPYGAADRRQTAQSASDLLGRAPRPRPAKHTTFPF